MRFSHWLAIPVLSCVLLSGCGEAEMKASNHAAMSSNREDLLLKLATSNESAGDLSGAERLYKQAADSAPDSFTAQFAFAEFYRRHGNDKGAIIGLNKALALQPGNAELVRELANSYIGAGEPEKALALLDKAIAADAKYGLLYNSRGVALDMLGRYDEAQKSYHTALKLDPADTMTFDANLSMSYMLQGTPDKAITLLLPLANAPDVTPNIRQNLALAYGLKGESEKALKLGLKDLSVAQAQENLKVYRTMNTGKVSKKKVVKAETPDIVDPEETYNAGPVVAQDDDFVPENVKALPTLKPSASKEKPAPAISLDLPLPVLKPNHF